MSKGGKGPLRYTGLNPDKRISCDTISMRQLCKEVEEGVKHFWKQPHRRGLQPEKGNNFDYIFQKEQGSE